jgi:ABC-type Fe3+/spermidine/putrescine transport system ATPase subunit
VLNEGQIEQVGEPDRVYRSPASPFVARFVGDSNVIPVELAADGETVNVAGHQVRVTGNGVSPGAAWLVLRPDVVSLSAPGTGSGIRGVVRDVSFRGTGHSYRLQVPGLDDEVKAEMREGTAFGLDEEVDLGWDAAACRLLPRAADGS